MALLIEPQAAESKVPSDYEMERNKPMPSTLHAAVQSNLVFEFKANYRETYRVFSEITLDTAPNASTPDVAVYPFVSLDFTKEYPAKRTDAPLLVIEIQSPSQSFDEMLDKTEVYFAFGVQSCWIVQPRLKGIFVFEKPNQYDFFHHEDVLRIPALGIEMHLTKIFE